MTRKDGFTVGLDLGGTKLAAALVDCEGRIVAFQKESILELKSGSREGPKRVVAVMGAMVSSFRDRFPQAFKKKDFHGVGLASAGPLNVTQGTLINPINFPGWKTVHLREMLEAELKRRRFPAKVSFQNDAIAAARAEEWIGGAKGLGSFAVITVGTGIGSGVIFNGQPVQSRGMGSEFGHTIVCSDRIRTAADLRKFSVEGIASGTGLLRRAREDMGFEGSCVEDLIAAIENGETQYQALFDEAADALAALCYDLSIGFNLERILFSGGLIKVRSLYFDRLKARYQTLITAFNPAFRCPLSVAKCLNQAGVIGAASLPYL